MGEGPEEAGGAGVLILPVAGEVVRRGPAPVPTPVGGTGKGARGRGGLGRGSAQLARGPVGGRAFSLFFLPVLFLLPFLFICLFSFLFYFI